MNANTQSANTGLEEALAKYAEMIARNDMYLTDKIGLTKRERNFAMYVISKAVRELTAFKRREKRTAEFADIEEYYKGMPEQKGRSIGYGYGQRNAARDIAGSSLSALFGGMGCDTINALEALAEREDAHTFHEIIVEEYYAELVKQWKRDR